MKLGVLKMGKNVFVSFRYSDGNIYKEKLCNAFSDFDVIDFSEDEDRSDMTEDTIRQYLYKKLKKTSVTIVVLTPEALNYQKDIYGDYDDWLYDELRYSLEERDGKRTNGVIAVYTPEVEKELFNIETHSCSICKENHEVCVINDFENLVRKNIMNIKKEYKYCNCDGLYDRLEDSYCSLISFDSFIKYIDFYVKNADSKRERYHEFYM